MNGFSPIDIAITSTYKDKGARQAQNSLTKLSKSASTLARNFGVAFSIAQLVRFGKASVSAYAAEEKSAKSLALTLGNLGQSFAVVDTEAFIAKIQKTRGILDDQLRPAMATLVSTTLDAKKSQDILMTALDLSAGAGVDLETATNALAKSYMGNNTALGKLNIGLTSSQIKTANFTEIQKQLNTQFAGQGEASASSFAGQMSIVAAQADVAKEIIGKGLVDAMGELNINAENTGGAMEFLAKQIASVTQGAAKFIRGNIQLLNTPISELVKDQSGSIFNYKMNIKTPYDPMSGNFNYEAINRKEKQLQADAAKAAKARLAAIAKERQLLIDQGKIKKSQGIMDAEQANILAALQGKISDNERLRLELQLALLTGNAKEADRLSNELLISQSNLTGLATMIAKLPKALNPFADYPLYIQQALAELAKLAAAQQNLQFWQQVRQQSNAMNASMTNLTPTNAAQVLANSPIALNDYQSITGEMSALGVKNMGQINITVNNAGSVVSDADLAEQIRQKLLNSNLSGSPSAIGRLLGAFA